MKIPILIGKEKFRKLVAGEAVTEDFFNETTRRTDTIVVRLADIGFYAMLRCVDEACNAAMLQQVAAGESSREDRQSIAAAQNARDDETESRLINEAIEQNGHAGVVTLCCSHCGRLVSTNYAPLRRLWSERRDSSAKRG